VVLAYFKFLSGIYLQGTSKQQQKNSSHDILFVVEIRTGYLQYTSDTLTRTVPTQSGHVTLSYSTHIYVRRGTMTNTYLSR
jgi:hypothetical protein